MLAIWENHMTLVRSEIAFVAKFRGHSENINMIDQRELAIWMQHPKMSNDCSVEVSTVLYARLRRDNDVLCCILNVLRVMFRKFFQLLHSLVCRRFELFRFEAVFAFARKCSLRKL